MISPIFNTPEVVYIYARRGWRGAMSLRACARARMIDDGAAINLLRAAVVAMPRRRFAARRAAITRNYASSGECAGWR